MKEKELSDRMDRLSESLCHGFPLMGNKELKYDQHSKNVVNFLGKTMKSCSMDLTCGAETLGVSPMTLGINFELERR